MKHFSFFVALLLLAFSPLRVQGQLNAKADNIVGTYSGKQGDDIFKARIEKMSDGTFRGRVVWLEHDRDKSGNKILDHKNPDKRLRSLPADQVVLFSGLRYDAQKQRWSGTKIYDPQRGLRANLVVTFAPDGMLCLKGSLMGISETVRWKKLE